jgi:hypothetical protein
MLADAYKRVLCVCVCVCVCIGEFFEEYIIHSFLSASHTYITHTHPVNSTYLLAFAFAHLLFVCCVWLQALKKCKPQARLAEEACVMVVVV